MEQWKDIKGYEGLYKINQNGDIYSFYKKRLMKPSPNAGYLKTCLTKYEVHKYLFIHRLIAQHFIPNPENKSFINHINGIKNDNRIENLEWCTASENLFHAYRVCGRVVNNKQRIQLSKRNLKRIKEGKLDMKKINEASVKSRKGKPSPKHMKPIVQFDINGNFIKEYSSSKQAANELGIPFRSISNNITGRSKTCGNFIFKQQQLKQLQNGK